MGQTGIAFDRRPLHGCILGVEDTAMNKVMPGVCGSHSSDQEETTVN